MRTRFRNKKVDADWLNTNFPCMMACPAQTNAGGTWRSLRKENSKKPTATRGIPIDGSVCGRCLRASLRDGLPARAIDKPIAIRRAEALSYRAAWA